MRGEREKQFAYSVYAANDAHGVVLGAIVTPGVAFSDLLDKVSDRLIQRFAVAADSGYKNPTIAKLLIDCGILPVFPYTRPKGKRGAFKTKNFIYDEHHDVYICPNNELLRYRTTMREGKRKYVSNPAVCVNCPLLEQFTKSQKHQRIIERHLWQPYMDEVEGLRHTELNRNIYDRRKQTVERVLADAKENHGMR